MRAFILPSSSPLAMRAGTCSRLASALISSAVGGGRGGPEGRAKRGPPRSPAPNLPRGGAPPGPDGLGAADGRGDALGPEGPLGRVLTIGPEAGPGPLDGLGTGA